jgi:hypothetical protein
MLETVSVLLIFFILVVLGFVFYAKVMRTNIQIEREEATQLIAVEVAERVIFLPELQCGQGAGVIKSGCIDILKMEAAIPIIEQNGIYYHDRLSFSKIVIEEIYPDSNEWKLYNRPLAEFSERMATQVPISLYDPREKTYSFGIMRVDVYSPK